MPRLRISSSLKIHQSNHHTSVSLVYIEFSRCEFQIVLDLYLNDCRVKIASILYKFPDETLVRHRVEAKRVFVNRVDSVFKLPFLKFSFLKGIVARDFENFDFDFDETFILVEQEKLQPHESTFATILLFNIVF